MKERVKYKGEKMRK